MAAILDIETERFCNSKSQVLAHGLGGDVV